MNEVFNTDCLEYMRTLPDKAFQLAIADPLNERDTLRRLIEEYRENRTLGNVLASVETLLDIDAQQKATRDFEAWEKLIKKNEN